MNWELLFNPSVSERVTAEEDQGDKFLVSHHIHILIPR